MCAQHHSEQVTPARVVPEANARAEPLYPASRLLKGNLIEARETEEAARKAVDAAKREIAQSRENARAELDGLREEARRRAGEQAAARFAELLSAAQREIDETRNRIAFEARQLVFRFAKAVLDAELRAKPELVVELVRSVLERAKAYSEITVVLHPEDLANVRDNGAALLDALPFAERIHFREDAELPPHGCRIETEMGTFDGSLDVQLERMHEAFEIGGDQTEDQPEGDQ